MDQKQGTETEMSAEQAADLARLQDMVGTEQTPGTEQVEPEPVPAVSAEQSMAGLLGMIGFAGPLGFPRLAAVWRQEACEAVADRAIPVFRKYAWGQRVIDFLETGSGVEEMALAMVAVPMVLASVQAVQADMAPEPEPEKGAGREPAND